MPQPEPRQLRLIGPCLQRPLLCDRCMRLGSELPVSRNVVTGLLVWVCVCGHVMPAQFPVVLPQGEGTE